MWLILRGPVLNIGSLVVHAFIGAPCALCLALCLLTLEQHGHHLSGNYVGITHPLSFFGNFVNQGPRRVLDLSPCGVLHVVVQLWPHLE